MNAIAMKSGITTLVVLLCQNLTFAQAVSSGNWPQYAENPFVFRAEIPPPSDAKGGLIVVDLNDDELMDYLITVPGHVAAYAHDGRKLWVLKVDVRVAAQALLASYMPRTDARIVSVASSGARSRFLHSRISGTKTMAPDPARARAN